MPVSQSYSWTGAISDDWNNPANWEDVTTQMPAVVAPGSLDAVTISNATISGSGSSASLTFMGNDTVLGNLNTGTLVVDGTGHPEVVIDAGGTITGATGTLSSQEARIVASGSGAVFDLNGTLQISGGAIGPNAYEGGFVQIGGLSASSPYYVEFDSTAIIEIGNAGSAGIGTLTIDQGYTLSGPGDISGTANITDNGLISTGTPGSAVLVLGLPYLGIHALTGNGTIEALAGDTIEVGDSVTTSGLTFQVDGEVTLFLDADIAAGNTINLGGSADILAIGNPVYFPTFFSAPKVMGATINDFNPSDTLEYNTGTVTAATFSAGVDGNPGTLSLLDGTTDVLNLHLTGDFDGQTFFVTPVSSSEELINVTCFVAGTRIATPSGDMLVEKLAVGHMVHVHSTGVTSVKWIGRRHIDCRRYSNTENVRPVRVRAGAFGDSQPRRDLWLSPDHAVFVDDVLIPIKYLVNGSSIARMPVDKVTYYHVELPKHDLLLAEGLLAESYLDVGDRSNFDNSGGVMRLFPDFSTRGVDACLMWEACGYAPLVVTGPPLEAVRLRLLQRSAELATGRNLLVRDVA